ncbi:MAG: helix-turn-helix transcriptional regulator [Chlorobium sp.]|nr:MAG: helix-turn-helix transcriptional regulator [Chlorobium sp.]
MGVDTLEEKLAAITAKEVSGWLDDAKYRIENERWLKHSQAFALRILRTLRAKNISQKELAEKIGVSPQHVNKIVKGRENLTLETISKLEAALEISLLMVPSLASDTESEIGQPSMPKHKTVLPTAKLNESR